MNGTGHALVQSCPERGTPHVCPDEHLAPAPEVEPIHDPETEETDTREPEAEGQADTGTSTHGAAWDKELEELGDAGLAAVLLMRMGNPLDRELVLKLRQKQTAPLELEPPYTAAKITGALASIALRIAQGKLNPQQANSLLFALQTLIGAVRVSITEEKWADKRAEKNNQQKGRQKSPTKKTPTTGSTPTALIRSSKTAASPPTSKPSPSPAKKGRQNATKKTRR